MKLNNEIIFQKKFKSYLILFVVMLVAFFILDQLLLNRDYVKYKLNGLETRLYPVENGKIYGFEIIDDKLISLHEDPQITISPINTKVGYVSINCTNLNPDAYAQVFFRNDGEKFNEINSLKFSMTYPENKLELPNIQYVDSIRLDLTNFEGDSITCQEFIINPPVEFHFSRRFAFLFIISFALIIGYKQMYPRHKQTIKEKFLFYSFWLFLMIIIIIDLVYPITITWDSGWYLLLADIIKEGNWVDWDPIRYLLFPLILYLSQELLGLNQNALLLPMIFSHLILFSFSYLLINELFQTQSRKFRFFIQAIVFFFVALDATVVGYFHTLLTEYVAATIAVVSSFVALKLYKSQLFSKQFYWWSSVFLVMVPIAWHLKQPYIGAAYFPFFMSCFLIILRKFSKQTLFYGLTANLFLIAAVFLSTFAWNSFLASEGNMMRSDRLVSSSLDRQIDGKINLIQEQPIWLVKDTIKRYLASTNLFQYDFKNRVLIYEPCFNCAFQNKLISHKMFNNKDISNLFYSPPYNSYTKYYVTKYNPPDWINDYFKSSANLSNFLYTITYLILPIFIVIFIIVWIKNKKALNAVFLILSVSSFLNSFFHLIMNSVLDRYRFWGYSLHLLIISLFIIQITNFLISHKNKHD